MSAEYLSNVIGHLTLYAARYHHGAIMRELIEGVADAAIGRVSAHELAQEAGAPSTTDLTPDEWLEGTPLMRAVRAELARRGR
ncbi:hypothetical protein L6241_03015 [Janibacter sp. Y6]|uniref:hypothetical protein n=1 Tax=Janibacter sp. Y6 TaxID=2913552 RepID=UPI0034A2B6F8